jgi:hypothetical protein
MTLRQLLLFLSTAREERQARWRLEAKLSRTIR